MFGAVSQRFRTPYVSIVVYALLTYALSLYGTFRWNVVLAAVGRVFTYGIVCLSVFALRHRRPNTEAFRLRAAPVWCGIGLAFLLGAAVRMNRGNLIAIGITTAVALANWVWVRQRAPSAAA